MNATNDWMLTPLAIAYLKGHMGIVELLLSLKVGMVVYSKENCFAEESTGMNTCA